MVPLLFIDLKGNKETMQSVANPGRRVYTVVPPPADFKAEESVNLPSSGSANSDKDSAGEKAVLACVCFLSLCHTFFV